MIDSEDRKTLAMAGIVIVAVVVGAATVGIAAGIAVRVFVVVSGL